MNWIIYLKTTETCNLNCKHCFTNGTSGAKIYWTPFKIIDWLEKFGSYIDKNDTVHCEFHGGEPFLVSPFEMSVVQGRTKALIPNSSWGITSNLVLKLTEDHYSFIKESLGNRVGTSWDPKIRFATPKQYSLWHSNVKELLRRGATVKLNISVTRDTINIEPAVLLRWIRKLGVQEVAFERLTGNGSALKHPDIFPSNKEQDAWFLKLHQESERIGAREWFHNEFLENIYTKFETGFTGAGTFCRDCEEKIFTINADGTIAGCPNSAPEEQFGNINMTIPELINNPIRLENMACEKSRNGICYSCEVFSHCGGDCHQLRWEEYTCGAPKSLMKSLMTKKVWMIKEI
jgi:radical SAM protein with 4Fe4S-binding SPASM domain